MLRKPFRPAVVALENRLPLDGSGDNSDWSGADPCPVYSDVGNAQNDHASTQDNILDTDVTWTQNWHPAPASPTP